MHHTIYISDDDYLQLKNFLAFIGKLIFSVDQSIQGEEFLSEFVTKVKKPPQTAESTFSEQILSSENLNSPLNNQDKIGFLKFTKQEILKMPIQFRKKFYADGRLVHVRRRKRSQSGYDYEARFRRNGYNISVSSTKYEDLKPKFLQKLKSLENAKAFSQVPTNFHEFSIYWFERYHMRKVKEKTYDHDIKLYNRHIKEPFKKFQINRITRDMLQDFLDNAPGKGKTAKDLYSILNQTFNCAVKHGLIVLNPLGMCFLEDYEQEHGVAISIENERKLLNAYAGTEFELYLAVILYTGLRPDEYTSATIDGNFIKAKNSKRKRKRKNSNEITYKWIPITPMLKPYLNGVTELHLPNQRIITRRLKKILPEHKAYDMRTTFQTRCDQCKISDTAIGIFMGNTIGKGNKLKEAYTDCADGDYMKSLFEEGQKFKY